MLLKFPRARLKIWFCFLLVCYLEAANSASFSYRPALHRVQPVHKSSKSWRRQDFGSLHKSFLFYIIHTPKFYIINSEKAIINSEKAIKKITLAVNFARPETRNLVFSIQFWYQVNAGALQRGLITERGRGGRPRDGEPANVRHQPRRFYTSRKSPALIGDCRPYNEAIQHVQSRRCCIHISEPLLNQARTIFLALAACQPFYLSDLYWNSAL